MTYRKGDIFLAKIKHNLGSIQSGTRPVVVIQNNTGNLHSTTVIVACITSQLKKPKQPTHVSVKYITSSQRLGQILCEQITTINKEALILRLGRLSATAMTALNNALKVSLDLQND